MNQFSHKQRLRWQSVSRCDSLDSLREDRVPGIISHAECFPEAGHIEAVSEEATEEVAATPSLLRTQSAPDIREACDVMNVVNVVGVVDISIAAKVIGKQWSLGDIQHPIVQRPRRSVSFLPRVGVMLIPCRREYLEAKVFDDVWWRDMDYTAFKEALLGDFYEYLRKQQIVVGGDLGRKVALKRFIEQDHDIDL